MSLSASHRQQLEKRRMALLATPGVLVATASLLENGIGEAEQRAWFLFASGRSSF